MLFYFLRSLGSDAVWEGSAVERLWHVTLLGSLQVKKTDRAVITRFATQKTASLLAYLSYYPDRSHSRELLAEMFWPEADTEAARLSLRVALTSLRRQLETLYPEAGSVLITTRSHVGLNPDAITTDVVQFEQCLRKADTVPIPVIEDDGRKKQLTEAMALYGGELLPGFYDDWIQGERERLSAACFTALLRLAALYENTGELDQAISWAGHAVRTEPLREDGNLLLLRLCRAANRPGDALAHYAAWERLLRETLNEKPSAEIQALIAPLMGASGSVTAPAPKRKRAMPPLVSTASLSARSTVSLPAPITRFFGREEERILLRGLLSPLSTLSTLSSSEVPSPNPTPRLLTLIGIGGTGKTRLALEAAEEAQTRFPGGVAFVSLADIAQREQIPGAILRSLQVAPSPEGTPLDQVVSVLRERTQAVLLLLDNMEHLLTEEGAVPSKADGVWQIQHLLECVPLLTCLVTSRQQLNLEGEHCLPVRPLPLPSEERSLESLHKFASVQLFSDRAQRARPDFQVTSRNAEAVAALCIRLEGIPLALELVAAWASLLTPRQMLERLNDGDRLLSSRHPHRVSRHQTLRATLDWSIAHLPAPLLPFWTRLSVFRGGWTAEGAEAVCENPRNPEREMLPETLQRLAILQERSLIYAEETPSGMRFQMLHALRQQGAERLSEPDKKTACQKHLTYFTAFAEKKAGEIRGANESECLEALEKEYPNLQAALEWGLQSGSALPLATNLWEFWLIRGRLREGRAYLAAALSGESTIVSETVRADALNGLGALAQSQGDYPAAQSAYEESLKLSERLGDRRRIAALKSNLGLIAEMDGRFEEARVLHEESLALRREVQDRRGMAASLNNLGVLAQQQQEYEIARQRYRESLTIKQELGEKRSLAHAFSNLGIIAHILGENTESEYWQQQALALRRELGDRQGVAFSLNNLGKVAETKGDMEGARALYDESLFLKRELGDNIGICRTLENLAPLALRMGDVLFARRCLEECLALLRQSTQNLQDIAGALCALMLLAVAQGEFERAAWLYGAGDGLLETAGIQRKPLNSDEFAVAQHKIEHSLTAGAFEALRTQGQRASLERVFRVALWEDLSPWSRRR